MFRHSKCLGFPGGSDGKESACQCRRPGFDPWIWKMPWRREWQPTSVFLPGEFHEQRSMASCSPRGLKRVGHGWINNTHYWSSLKAILYKNFMKKNPYQLFLVIPFVTKIHRHPHCCCCLVAKLCLTNLWQKSQRCRYCKSQPSAPSTFC